MINFSVAYRVVMQVFSPSVFLSNKAIAFLNSKKGK